MFGPNSEIIDLSTVRKRVSFNMRQPLFNPQLALSFHKENFEFVKDRPGYEGATVNHRLFIIALREAIAAKEVPMSVNLVVTNPATSPVEFSFEGLSVRTVTQRDEPWFVAADVAKVLEIGRTDDAVRRLDDDEKGTDIIRTPGGSQEMTVINESGLYSLILTSRKPSAKRFKKWVTAEVLPAIRKTGGYMVAAHDETPEELALRAMTVLQDTVARQKAQIEAQAPKVAALDRIATSEGSLCITDTAKTVQRTPKEMFAFLREHRWIYRRPNTAHDVGYQDKINAGLLEHKTTQITKTDGTEKTVTQVRVTPKGLARISEIIGSEGAA